MTLSATRIGILISGRGSNMETIVQGVAEGRVHGEVALVVSNVAGAPGLAKAEALDIPTTVLDHRGKKRTEHDRAMGDALEEAGVELACLAGYMRLLSASFVRRFAGKILNVHPSLLPSFPGLNAQGQALEYGARVSGCTVHFVDEELDHGPIILQEAVPIHDTDTPDELSARILRLEHRLYPEAVDLVARGAIRVEGRRVFGA